MEKLLEFFWLKRKEPQVAPRLKKPILVPVPNMAFQDFTLTKEYLTFLEERIAMHSEALIKGAWESEGEAKELVGYLRACEELKEKYQELYRQLYNNN